MTLERMAEGSLAYLDERQVDELWATLKKSAVPKEQKDDVENKVSAKFSAGLGNIIKQLIGDLDVELGGEKNKIHTVTSDILSPYKLQILIEFVDDLVQIVNITPNEIREKLESIGADNLVNIRLPYLRIVPLCTMSQYMMASSYIQKLKEMDANNEEIASFIINQKSLSDYDRAFAFLDELEGKREKEGTIGTLNYIYKNYEELLFDALRNSNGGESIAMSQINAGDEEPITVIMFCNDYAIRGNSKYAGSQCVEVLGRVVSKREKLDISKQFEKNHEEFMGDLYNKINHDDVEEKKQTDLLCVEPISIRLT